ncbi:MAG: ACT domain-containing protein [Erysipelotrichaceae bacterium]|nr:ACT domain-containing protein [Erysipelotrichaceae bacterium]
MADDLLIVHKKLLPKCYEKVVEAKKLLNDGRYDSISKVCEVCGISRSTFYKYQDYVFSYEENSEVRKLVVSLALSHRKGSLSKVCDKLSKLDISILTISQSIPIDDIAQIMLSLDISNMKADIDEFKKVLSKIPEVSQLKVMSFEK